MTKICKSCNHQNLDAHHYCVKCGKPLETGVAFRPRTYVVISEDEYKGLKGKETTLANLQRSHRTLQNNYNNLRNNTNNSWGMRMQRKLSDFWDEWGISIITYLVIGFLIWGIVALVKSCESRSDNYFVKIVQDENTGKYGLFNEQTEQQVLACEYDTIIHERAAHYHFFYTRQAALWGVTDSLGNVTIDCSLDSVRASSLRTDCVLITYANDKQGLMSNYGQVILPCEYAKVLWDSDMRHFSKTFSLPGNYIGNIIPAKMTANGQWILFNRNGERVSQKTYYDIQQTCHPDLVQFRNKSEYKYGLVDVNGKEVLPCSYNQISIFGDDRAWIRGGRTRTSIDDNMADVKWMCIDPQGKVIFSFPGNYTVNPFTHGLASVLDKDDWHMDENAKLGFCDVNGNMVIPMNYNLQMTSERGYLVPVFTNDANPRAPVSYQGKKGYLTTDGKFHEE